MTSDPKLGSFRDYSKSLFSCRLGQMSDIEVSAERAVLGDPVQSCCGLFPGFCQLLAATPLPSSCCTATISDLDFHRKGISYGSYNPLHLYRSHLYMLYCIINSAGCQGSMDSGASSLGPLFSPSSCGEYGEVMLAALATIYLLCGPRNIRGHIST